MSLRETSTRATRILATALAAVALLADINAATLVVTSTADDGSAGTLRAALAGAADGDTIDATELSGTITLMSGELVVDTSVAILGPGAASLSVDANQLSRVFRITPGHTVTLDGMTIVNGFIDGEFSPDNTNIGGGIYNDASDLTVSDCNVSSNSAYVGGGIYNDGSVGSAVLAVTNSTFNNNSATNSGGGIFNDGFDLVLRGSAVLTVTDSTFSSNSANYGGGIYNADAGGTAVLTVANSTFSGNSALHGGGITHDNFQSTGSAVLTVTNSTFNNNSATNSGGGVYNEDWADSAALIVANCTFSGNSAGNGGGGIFNNYVAGSPVLTVTNSTFSSNSATDTNSGGGIYNWNGQLEIGSTILNASSIFNFFGAVTSEGFNLSSDDGGGFLTAIGDQIDIDSMLGPLADNGGPTLTHLPQLGSPAIDQSSAVGLVSLGITTDQRGSARILDDPAIDNATGGDGSDIGAIEVTPEDYTPADRVDSLVDAVDELISLGAILPANGNSLKSKLNSALAALPDNPATAISALQSFINQVKSFIKTGRLSATDSQALIDAAQDIIDELSM
jgi:predicted outer membrane repeat protein